MRLLILFFFLSLSLSAAAQSFSVKGKVTDASKETGVSFIVVGLKGTTKSGLTDENGNYEIKNVVPGQYTLLVAIMGYKKYAKEVIINNEDLVVNIKLEPKTTELGALTIKSSREKTSGFTRLKDVEGTAIYAGKKSEVVVMQDVTANTATNNSRQIYSKVAGLNIWENDGAGIQLGIGGRGLNPNRVTNFNTRQNGYDISADALGYPESYYSPATEAVDRIEIVRGAASLQYGTQFGGLVNFKLKTGPEDKKIQLVSRQTLGSFGFFNTFNSLGGSIKKVNYYVFYQNKSGNGWRPNSEFKVNTAYAGINYAVNTKFNISVQYTFMNYLAHQPGGLTDKMFEQDPHQSIRTRNWFNVNWNLGAVMLDYKFSEKLKLNTRFFGLAASRSALGILSFINRADPMTERDLWIDKYNNYGNETRLMYSYETFKNPSTFLIGARYYKGFTDRRQGLGNSASTGYTSDFKFDKPDDLEYSKYTFPNQNISVFAENIFRLTPTISVIPGIRFETIRTEADGFYNIVNKNLAGKIIYSQRTDENRVNKRSFLLGGLGLSYSPNDNIQCYANASQNYRAINFNDMRVANPSLQVDPNLKDEKGYSADLGLRGNIRNIFTYDLSLFLISYDNRIGTVLKVDSTTYTIYRYRTNISHSRNLGVESFAEVDLWRLIKGDSAKARFSVFSNLSFIDARYVKSQQPAFENKMVELAPQIIFKTGLSYKFKRIAASSQFSYTGRQYTDASNAEFTSNAVNGLIPSYYIVDCSVDYMLNKYLSLSATANNITNNIYFTRRADSYPGPGIIPSDARSFFITLQVKL